MTESIMNRIHAALKVAEQVRPSRHRRVIVDALVGAANEIMSLRSELAHLRTEIVTRKPPL